MPTQVNSTITHATRARTTTYVVCLPGTCKIEHTHAHTYARSRTVQVLYVVIVSVFFRVCTAMLSLHVRTHARVYVCVRVCLCVWVCAGASDLSHPLLADLVLSHVAVEKDAFRLGVRAAGVRLLRAKNWDAELGQFHEQPRGVVEGSPRRWSAVCNSSSSAAATSSLVVVIVLLVSEPTIASVCVKRVQRVDLQLVLLFILLSSVGGWCLSLLCYASASQNLCDDCDNPERTDRWTDSHTATQANPHACTHSDAMPPTSTRS